MREGVVGWRDCGGIGVGGGVGVDGSGCVGVVEEGGEEGVGVEVGYIVGGVVGGVEGVGEGEEGVGG